MEEIIKAISEYGLESVVIALAINLLTGLIKLPLKKFAGRLEDSTKATRFIVFLPIIFGFALSALYVQFFNGGFKFNQPFITLCVTSSSLSLTFYAIFEKLFPKKQKVLTDEEIAANQAVLNAIQNTAGALPEQIAERVEETAESQSNAETSQTEEPVQTTAESIGQTVVHKKIILRGKRDEQTETEK